MSKVENMTIRKRNVTELKTTLIATAITLAFTGSAIAEQANSVKTISLIKKPISLLKKYSKASEKKEGDVIKDPVSGEVRDNSGEVIDNAYDDIARLLNQLPGVFAVNRFPNDNSPSISHHSDPLTSNVLLLNDNVAFSSSPFYLKDNKHITPLFFANGNSVDSSSIKGFPVVTASNITSSTPSVDDVANVKLNIGSNKKLGVSIDHGKDNDKFGHRFYAATQKVDSHREFKDGDQGQFDSNEIFLKIKENSSGNNKKTTQVFLHYKDFSNDESFIGLSDVDVKNSPQHRYSATKLDNISGDQLSLGINHQTSLFSGETITTDLYYNTGELDYYQTGSINGNVISSSAQLLSDFEASPNGELLVVKESLGSNFTSSGIKFDIAQKIKNHQINLGFEYHKEEIKQKKSLDIFTLDQQLALSQVSAGDTNLFIDATAKIKGLYLTDHWQNGRWSIDSGIKYLSIKDRREFDETTYTEDSDDATIYNLQLNYNVSPTVSLYVGTTQGAITTLAADDSGLPKLNNQITAGLLYKNERGFISLKAFDNEFENVLSRCDSQETCQTVNNDRSDIEINAFELSGGFVTHFDNWSLPVTFNITSRDAQYSGEASSLDLLISPKDNLALLPEQQFTFKTGMQFEKLYVGTRIEYRGEQRLSSGQTTLDGNNSIDAVTLVDFDANYYLSKQHLLSFAIENILDEEYIETASSAGKMVGRNRFINLKYQYNF